MELYVHEKPVATPPRRDLSSHSLRLRLARAVAQGIQTGVITGVINSADGLSLPGVTVTATSPNLQGPRSGVTDANGVYYLRGLTPGLYLVTFEIPSFQAASREDVEVNAGATRDGRRDDVAGGRHRDR